MTHPPIADLFQDAPDTFRMRWKRDAPDEYFGPSPERDRLLRERARRLDESPAECVALQEDGAPLLAEAESLARNWVPPGPGDAAAAEEESHHPLDRLEALGRRLEPDLLVVGPGDDGRMRLLGGCLCFPTGWCLRERLGESIERIHGVVPGLNAAIGPAIETFLARLRPGIAWRRHNWGLAATDTLNLHPSRGLPAPDARATLDTTWLRVEHQALLALPESGGVLFGIRLALHRLDTLDGEARTGLARALEGMPDELLIYKRLAGARDALVRQLD